MTAPAPRRASCRWLIVTTVRDRPVHDNLLEACLVFGLRNLRLTKEKTVFPCCLRAVCYVFIYGSLTPKILNHSSSIFYLSEHFSFLFSI